MRSQSGTPASRKRRQSRIDHEESSSQPSAKKLRVTAGTPPRASPRALKSITSASSGAYNYGRRHSSGKSPKHAKENVPLEGSFEHPEYVEDLPPRSAIATSRSPARKSSSVYDLPDSEDELSTPIMDRSRSLKKAQALAGTDTSSQVQSPSTQRKRGRPKKDRKLSEAESDGTVDVSPKSRKKLERLNDTLPEKVPKLKGILTPSRRKDSNRPQKSVAFGRGERTEQPEVFFEDLPSKSAKSKTSSAEGTRGEGRTRQIEDDGKTARRDEEVDEDEDDEVCSICSKPDSAPPNEIIFCDGCDMAVHQECYNVETVPEGDWLCKSCSQDDIASHGDLMRKHGEVVAFRGKDQAPDLPNFDHHLRSLQRVLLERCTGRRRIKPHCMEEAYEKTHQLVEQTIVAGEGNSMLVIGARGTGKATLVESVIAELALSHKTDFHIVRLNGFTHTDDKLALKEIWRQLGKEMEVEDDLVNQPSNYADTLASLLALLSHPSEISGAQESVTSRSVVFIIDEFDLFATHARQTLLYNLFDIAQAKKAPIAVLGLTTRIDVVESLEKRVKSRFSHRYVYLSLPKSLPAYWDICRHGLTLDDEDMLEEGVNTTLEGWGKFIEWWNKKIETLHKDVAFKDNLETHFYTTKSVSAFWTSCILPLSLLSTNFLDIQSYFSPSSRLPCIDSGDTKLQLLDSLSDLDLSLLIAAARLDIVAHTDTVNFAMAYEEYVSLMGRQRVQSASSGLLALGGTARVWGRGVAGVAWERLVSLGLLVPAGVAGRGAAAGVGGLEAKMWKLDVALEEIPAAVKLNAVLARWCREI